MSNTVTKTFTTAEIVNIVGFLNHIIETKAIDELSVKFKWAIRKSMKDLVEVDSKFKEFREEYINELRTKYFMDDEKSEPTTLIEKDENGNDIEVDGRKVKPEYLEEYNKELNDINEKLHEILTEDNDVTISVIDIDAEIDKLPDDTKFTFEDLEMLSVFDKGDA